MGLQFQMFKTPKKVPMSLEKTPLEELKKHFCKITGTEYVEKNTKQSRQNKPKQTKAKQVKQEKSNKTRKNKN